MVDALSKERFKKRGYMIYPRGQYGLSRTTYFFDKVIGQVPDVNIKDNYNRTELKTFGKFPSVFYVGNTNYRTFSLQTVFVTDIPYENTISNDEIPISITAYQKYVNFKKLVDSRIPWCIRSTISGEDFVCDIEIAQTIHNQNSAIRKGGDNQQDYRDICDDIFFCDYIQVTINCTEVDDFEYGVDGPDDSFDKWSED